jgi:hypothetical protein
VASDDVPDDWRAALQARIDALPEGEEFELRLPFARIELDGGMVWDCALRRLKNIDDAELRAGLAIGPGAIDNMIMARTDPALIKEQALLLEGGKLALRLRGILAAIPAAELAAEVTRLSLVPDHEIGDGAPRLAMATHHELEGGKASDEALRPHLLRLEAAWLVLAQRREAGVSLGEGSGAGMSFPGVADLADERRLN